MSGSDALSRLELDDIAVDSTGKVVITNTELANALKTGLDLDAGGSAPNNGCNFVQGGCQTNTSSHCGAITAEA